MLPFFDEEELLKPSMLARRLEGFPDTAVIVWSNGLCNAMKDRFKPRTISTFRCGVPVPVYGLRYRKDDIAFVHLPIGAPVSAGFIEEYAVGGVKRFVCIGTCGSLSPLTHGKLIVPTHAYRDEGTSWHYASHDDPWIKVRTSMETDAVLDTLGVPHICGKVWTCDSFYRETPSAIRLMKEQGCLAVEMECAANMAVAQYRGLDCYQILFPADRLEGDYWDSGSFGRRKRSMDDRLLEIALEVAVSK